MGDKFTDDVYLILTAERGRWNLISGMNVSAMRKTKPSLRSGEVAVKVKLSIDSSLFEQFIPEIEAEIEGHDIIVPEVKVLDQPEESP